jgi:hypothetical protein
MPAPFHDDAEALETALADLRTRLLAALGDLPADPAGRESAPPIVINGPITITGVQDIESLYDALHAEAQRRNLT